MKGTFLTNQVFARHHGAEPASGAGEAPPPGAIVNISSIVGKCGNLGQANYAASKSGVVGFTKTCAAELAPRGIRVNAILPGIIDTPMQDSVPDKVKAQFAAMIPMGRTGSPEEVADAAIYLMSPRSSFVTATTLEVTGGMWP